MMEKIAISKNNSKKKVLENLRKELEKMDPKEFVLLYHECFKNPELTWNAKLNDKVSNVIKIDCCSHESTYGLKLFLDLWEICNMSQIIAKKYSQFLLQKSEADRLEWCDGWFDYEVTIDEINCHLNTHTDSNLKHIISDQSEMDFIENIFSRFYDGVFMFIDGVFKFYGVNWFLYKNLQKISLSTIGK